jgi:hypothetical protein
MSRTLFSLAGFQVITIGRFWVIAEGRAQCEEIRTLRSMRRGLETWQGRDNVTLANRKGEKQGTQTSTYTDAPVLDPTETTIAGADLTFSQGRPLTMEMDERISSIAVVVTLTNRPQAATRLCLAPFASPQKHASQGGLVFRKTVRQAVDCSLLHSRNYVEVARQ